MEYLKRPYMSKTRGMVFNMGKCDRDTGSDWDFDKHKMWG